MRQPGTNQNHWTAIPAAGNQFASEVMAAAARVLRLAMRLPPNKRNELPSLHASGPSRETAPYHVRDTPGRRESGESSLLHTGLFGLDRRTRDRAVRTEHTTVAGFCL